MGTGEVDLNWAEEHHSLWVEEELEKSGIAHRDTRHAAAAAR
jgi:formate dehydrogenase subunit gamma